jgi:hypothetical protein
MRINLEDTMAKGKRITKKTNKNSKKTNKALRIVEREGMGVSCRFLSGGEAITMTMRARSHDAWKGGISLVPVGPDQWADEGVRTDEYLVALYEDLYGNEYMRPFSCTDGIVKAILNPYLTAELFCAAEQVAMELVEN